MRLKSLRSSLLTAATSGVFLLLLTTAAGEEIYSESFEAAPLYVAAKGPNENNISSVSYGAGTSGFPGLKPGEYGGTGQYLGAVAIPGSSTAGALRLGSADEIHGNSRNRSYVTVIDTSSAKVGQYELTFKVSDFQSADSPNTSLYLHLYEGSHTNRGHVKYQLTSQEALPELVSTKPLISTAMGAMNFEVITNHEIAANGDQVIRFGLTEVGEPGNYLAIVWSQVKTRGFAPMPSMTIDDVKVERLEGGEPSLTTETAPFGQEGEWTLVEAASDEFETDGINPEKWNSNPGSWGAWSWDEANVTQEEGNLSLAMTHDPHTRNHTNLFYKSGIVRSHQEMTYGYFEARLKGCDLFPGACPAFWIYSDGRQYTGEVRYCEIDFVELQMNEINRETGERDSVHHIDMNLHLRLADETGKVNWFRPGSHPELCKNSWVAPWDPREDFHVYGCEVTPEMITWYIDGEQVAQSENTYWHLPMRVVLSLGLRHPHIGWVGQDMKPVPGAATAEGFPTTAEVDWVRVWERKGE